jgi:hypothetical protein
MIFSRFEELGEYAGLSLKELRNIGIARDAMDLGWRRKWRPYKPDVPDKKKGALIQAVEAVERYLRTQGLTLPVEKAAFLPDAPAEFPPEEIILFCEESPEPEGPRVFNGKSMSTLYRVLWYGLFPAVFVALITGALAGTGLSKIISESLPGGIFMTGLICALPLVSPLTGPGMFIVRFLGLLTGEQIAAGQIGLIMALPVLFAIDAQAGSEFISPGLAMGKTEPATINAGVPAIVFSRLITVPAAVTVACLVSFAFR